METRISIPNTIKTRLAKTILRRSGKVNNIKEKEKGIVEIVKISNNKCPIKMTGCFLCTERILSPSTHFTTG